MSTRTLKPEALVLFDLDGTLIETAADMTDALRATLARWVEQPALTQAEVEHTIGHGTRDLLAKTLVAAGVVRAETVHGSVELAEAETLYAAHYLAHSGRASRLYPHVEKTLAALRAAGVACVLLTNKEERYTRPLLQAHGLDSAFDRVVCGDTLPVKKPDPRAILECLDHFAVPTGRALMVGDSAVDVETARRAGIQVWAVPYGYNHGRPVAQSAPDRLIDTVGVLLSDWLV